MEKEEEVKQLMEPRRQSRSQRKQDCNFQWVGLPGSWRSEDSHRGLEQVHQCIWQLFWSILQQRCLSWPEMPPVITRKLVPRHIQLAIRNDEELNKLLQSVTIASGGVLPNIHVALLPRKGKGDKVDQSQDAWYFFNKYLTHIQGVLGFWGSG